jgi:ATP-dependent DNA ligase
MDSVFERLMLDPGWVAQAKLNGRRAIWDGDGVLWSRQHNKINSIAPSVVEALEGCTQVLDGEFIRTKGASDGVFWIFDLPDHPGTLTERWEALCELMSIYTGTGLRLCPSEVTWVDVEENSWEGIVLKKRNSGYVKPPRDGKLLACWIKYRAEWL